MNAFVTGGSGFIGAAVVERLLAHGDRVKVLRRPRTASRPDRLAGLASPRLEIVTGEIADPAALARASRDCSVVYHLAFLYRRAWQVGEDLLAPNLEATRRVLRAAAAAGAVRVVLSSSVSVYGWLHPPGQWPLDENTPLRGWGTYPETKIRSEMLVRELCREHGMQPVLLRLPHVYGPGASTFERFVEGLLQGRLRRPWEHGLDPTLEWGRVWHLVHVRDAADAIVRAGTAGRLVHDAFNVAGDTAVTRTALRALVRRLAGGLQSALALPLPAFRLYDIRRARDELGFTPRVRVIDGVREVLDRLSRSAAAA